LCSATNVIRVIKSRKIIWRDIRKKTNARKILLFACHELGVRREDGAAGVRREDGAAGVRREDGGAGVGREEGAAGVGREDGAAGVRREEGAAGVCREDGAGEEVGRAAGREGVWIFV
jgi:hypothetical protein